MSWTTPMLGQSSSYLILPSQQWQQLFCYTRAETISHIEQHRSNFSRERVSDEHWETVRYSKEAHNYDREAYEHEIERGRTKEVNKCNYGLGTGQASGGQKKWQTW